MSGIFAEIQTVASITIVIKQTSQSHNIDFVVSFQFKSQITGADTHEIEIKTTPKHIFKAIINFIYTG